LAVEATSELVSARLFPVLRENTAKFVDFRPQTNNDPRRSNVNSIAYHRNSLAAKTGKIEPPSREKLEANRQSEMPQTTT
jgi:hypothetical protein